MTYNFHASAPVVSHQTRLSMPSHYKFNYIQNMLTGFRYSLWIPYQLCTLSIQQCSDNCNNDAKCSQLCFNGKKCGASNPTRVNVTTTASTATATGSQGSYPTGTGTGTGTGNTSPTNNPFNSFATSLTDLTSFHAFGAIIVGVAIGLFEIL